MKEFGVQVPVKVNLVPTAEMERESQKRVARVLEITHKHVLESQTNKVVVYAISLEDSIRVRDEQRRATERFIRELQEQEEVRKIISAGSETVDPTVAKR